VTRPLVSVLCVTHDRPEWMAWLARQWARQTLDDFELIVVDSTEDDEQRMKNLRVLTDRLHDRVRYVSTEDNVVPEKYDLALDLAQGNYVVLSGDDDWQHPNRLLYSVEAIERAPFVEWVGFLNSGVFVSMPKDLVSVHDSPFPPASTLIARSWAAKRASFAGSNIAGDTRWSNGVMHENPGLQYPKGEGILSMWFRHSKNITTASGAPMAAHTGFDMPFMAYTAQTPTWDELDEAEYVQLRDLTFAHLGIPPRDRTPVDWVQPSPESK
jgi:glycosyltransferase involved in cell wall biosynthesis